MTDATYRGPGPNEQVFVHRIRTIAEPTEYPENDRRERSRRDGVARDPYAWTPASAIVMGLIGLAITVVLGLAVLSLSDCDTGCMNAKKEAAIAHETTLRAIANADANARAGFGNDDDMTKQKAVMPHKPERIVPPPAQVIYAPPAQVIYPPAPADVPPRSTCSTCYVGPSASLPGKIGTCDNGQQTNRPQPVNGVWVPKVNPRSGQCTWWNAEGNAPVYRS